MTLDQINQQLKIATDPNEIDFLYDQLFEYRLEQDSQASEHFPGQPVRRSK